MQLTGNYNLKKPDYNNVADVEELNDNFDIIDKAMKQISDLNSLIYSTSNTGNNYNVSIPNLTALRDGYSIRVKFNAASTGAITINPSTLGAKAVVDYFGKPVTNVRKDLIANLVYDATNGNFQLLGKGGGGNLTSADLLINKTATGDNGPVIGSIPIKAGQTYFPSTLDQVIGAGQYIGENQIVKGDSNLIASNIISGKSIFGIVGSATIESLGGKRVLINTIYSTPTSPSHIYLSCNFKPQFIMFKTVDSDGDNYVHCYWKGFEFIVSYVHRSDSNGGDTYEAEFNYLYDRKINIDSNNNISLQIGGGYCLYDYIIVGE